VAGGYSHYWQTSYTVLLVVTTVGFLQSQVRSAVCRFYIKAGSQIFADYLQNIGGRFGSISGRHGREGHFTTVVRNPARTPQTRQRSFCFQIGFIPIIPRRHRTLPAFTVEQHCWGPLLDVICFRVVMIRVRHWPIEKFDIIYTRIGGIQRSYCLSVRLILYYVNILYLDERVAFGCSAFTTRADFPGTFFFSSTLHPPRIIHDQSSLIHTYTHQPGSVAIGDPRNSIFFSV